jgi:hypothetical protein
MRTQLLDLVQNQLQWHEYQAGLAFGILCLILFGCRNSGTARAILESQQLFRIVVVLGVVFTLAYVLTAILYLADPNYSDHLEPTVSAISWLGTHGHAIYPDWQTGDVYEVPYGPLLFLTNGTVLRLFPTIFGSKLAGLTAFLIALALTYFAFKAKASDDRGVAFLLLIIVTVTFSFFREFPFWNRPEPFLILIGILTVIAVLKLPETAAAITIGILAGLALGFKLNGVLCGVPAALAVYGAREKWRDRIRLATLSAMGAAVAAALPFLLNPGNTGSMIQGYLSVLLVTTTHGIALRLFLSNLLFALLLFAPITIAWHTRRPRLSPSESWFLGGLLASLAMTTIVASKPGASIHHFFALVPISAYGLLCVLEAPTPSPAPGLNARAVGTMVLVSLLISYAGPELMWIKQRATMFATLQTEKRKIEELQVFYSQYAPAEVGPSDDNHYRDSFYRTLLVFRGAPMHVDFAAWMDLAYAGVAEARIVWFLKQCNVPVWILPVGAPFAMTSYYTRLPLLSDDFRRTFFANYRLIRNGEFYQVWRC